MDGTPAKLGKSSGFGTLIKKHAPGLVVIHCRPLHRDSLSTQILPTRLLEAFNYAVKAVNFIRAHALNHHLFKILCQELGSEHDVLLYHSGVRWLSRGRILTRVMELQIEIAVFLLEKKKTSSLIIFMTSLTSFNLPILPISSATLTTLNKRFYSRDLRHSSWMRERRYVLRFRVLDQ